MLRDFSPFFNKAKRKEKRKEKYNKQNIIKKNCEIETSEHFCLILLHPSPPPPPQKGVAVCLLMPYLTRSYNPHFFFLLRLKQQNPLPFFSLFI